MDLLRVAVFETAEIAKAFGLARRLRGALAQRGDERDALTEERGVSASASPRSRARPGRALVARVCTAPLAAAASWLNLRSSPMQAAIATSASRAGHSWRSVHSPTAEAASHARRSAAAGDDVTTAAVEEA